MKSPSSNSPIFEVYYDTDRTIQIELKDDQQAEFDYSVFDIKLNIFRMSEQNEPPYSIEPVISDGKMLFDIPREQAKEMLFKKWFYELEYETGGKRGVWIANEFKSLNVPQSAMVQTETITINDEMIVVDVEGAVNTAQAVKAAADIQQTIDSLEDPLSEVVRLAEDVEAFKAVYASGAQGSNSLVSKALAGDQDMMPVIGVTTEAGASGDDVRIKFKGPMEMDTSAFEVNDVLYPSPDVAGDFTNVRPSHPNFAQPIAIVKVVGVGNGLVNVNVPPHLAGRETGTNQNQFKIGDEQPGEKKLTADNGFNQSLNFNPTENREVDVPDESFTIESTTGAQSRVDTHEAKEAPHSGHETPSGAQSKADQAETNANNYTDDKASLSVDNHKSAGIGDHDDVDTNGQAEGYILQFDANGNLIASSIVNEIESTLDTDPFLAYVLGSIQAGATVNDIDQTRKTLRGFDA